MDETTDALQEKLDQVPAAQCPWPFTFWAVPSLLPESLAIQTDMIPPIPPRSPLRHDRGVLRKCDGRRNELARSQQIEWIPLLTAKMPRARREQAMSKKEETEPIAEQVVDAMLKVHSASNRVDSIAHREDAKSAKGTGNE